MAHIRKQASQNFAKILEVYKGDAEKQEELVETINRDLCRSRVYTERQAYIYMAASVMNSNADFFAKYMKTRF
jgi:aspartate/glutamate racemase